MVIYVGWFGRDCPFDRERLQPQAANRNPKPITTPHLFITALTYFPKGWRDARSHRSCSLKPSPQAQQRSWLTLMLWERQKASPSP